MIKRATASVAAAGLLAVACSCASHSGTTGGSSRSQTETTARARVAPAGGLGFDLVNFTGSTIRAVYVSSNDSKGWEENLLGADGLNDGDTIRLRFDPREDAALWDIRVEGTDDHFAVWKGLELRGASRVTLLVKIAGQPSAVAEVE